MTNAIILAAGKGTRLLPITLTKHKTLVEINKKPVIEKIIETLLKQDIEKIIIVVGYLKEQFYYLTKKYPNIELLSNDNYDKYNNIYSIYKARKYLKDCFIIEGDIYIHEFDFSPLQQSTYFVKETKTKKQEWIVESDSDRKITNIYVDYVKNAEVIAAGITYLIAQDGIYLNKEVKNAVQNANFDLTLHWDKFLIKNLHNFNLYSKLIQPNITFEIDDLQDLNETKIYFEKNTSLKKQ